MEIHDFLKNKEYKKIEEWSKKNKCTYMPDLGCDDPVALEILLKNDALETSPWSYEHAARHGSLECLKLLDKYKVTRDFLNRNSSAVYDAGNGGHIECVKWLINNGFFWSKHIPGLVGGHADVVEYFLELNDNKFDPNDYDSYIEEITSRKLKKSFEYCEKKGFISENAKKNVISYACDHLEDYDPAYTDESTYKDQVDMIKYLIDKGYPVNEDTLIGLSFKYVRILGRILDEIDESEMKPGGYKFKELEDEFLH